jgi:regulator of sigma E protease
MFDFLLSNDWLSAIIAFILVLIPAVLIHELGHFLAAKRVGITILEFGIGLPPRMLKLGMRNGVEYTLNWLPLGGFVRPMGEDTVRQMGDEALADDRQIALERGITDPKSVNQVSPGRRIFFMAAGALANFLLAFVLLTIVGLVGIPQITGGRANVMAVTADSALATAGLQPGDVIEQVNGATFVTALAGLEAIQAASGDVTLTLRREGVAEPFSVTVPAGSMTGGADPHPIIMGIAPESPAEAAGLQPGDVVLAFNGEPMASREDLQTTTRSHLDQLITLTVWRNGDTLDLQLTPRGNPPAGQGAMGIEISSAASAGDFGLVVGEGQPQQSLQPLTLGGAMQFALERMWTVIDGLLSLPGRLLQGNADPNELRVVSPLGLSQAGGVFLQESIQQERPTIILEYVALISMALGLTNLLPIPALDGGRILFVVVEIIRGRPVSPEREGRVHLIGLLILLSLMAVVLVNDIFNPITDLLR